MKTYTQNQLDKHNSLLKYNSVKANIKYISFRNANLRDATLGNANFNNTTLSSADLRGASTSDTDLSKIAFD